MPEHEGGAGQDNNWFDREEKMLPGRVWGWLCRLACSAQTFRCKYIEEAPATAEQYSYAFLACHGL